VPNDVVIKVENLWKQYRYGTISHASLRKDLQSWWARVRGKEDPNLPVDYEQSAKRKANSSDAMLSAPGAMHEGDDRFWALQDISFEVKQGEVLGIIGRNGAGKSTLLKIMSKVTTPTKGQIKIKGRVASLLEVGTGFHPELTGRENIFLNGAILGMSKAEIKKKFDEIVAFAEVEKFIDTPVKRYSSGMYVRLAFAVAAHLEPEILLVDEVLAVGDAQFQKKCLGKMGDVVKEGRTVLFVSHNMGAVEKLCGKTLYLNNGKIFGFTHSNNVISQYISEITTATAAPLEERKDRYGSGVIKATSIEIRSNDTVGGTAVRTGEFARVEICYEVVSDSIPENVTVAVGIDDMMNNRIMTLWSKFNKEIFGRLTNTGKFICEIPELCLRTGSYFVHVFMDSNGIIADYVHNAYKFNVEYGKFYDSGLEPSGDQGYILHRHRWKMS